MLRLALLLAAVAAATTVGVIAGITAFGQGFVTQSGAPGLMSYQGYLSDSAGQPISGTVNLRFGLYETSTGGSPLWQETQNNVQVSSGFFSVLLGSISPLSAAFFSDTTRYLGVAVDTGSGFTSLPRQRLASVPYAFQAQSVPWSGITDKPSGIGGYQYVVTVAKSGGDYTSVYSATASITNASSSRRYLVWVAPGTYTETQTVALPEYVHVKGSGPTTTIITGVISATTVGGAASLVLLNDWSALSDIAVFNSGATASSIAVGAFGTSRNTVIDNVHATAGGNGGNGHTAVYVGDGEVLIRNSVLRAHGATVVNSAFANVNGIQSYYPRIENSRLVAGLANADLNDNCSGATGTGFGMFLSRSVAQVDGSFICGDFRAISLSIAGNPQITSSSIKGGLSAGAFTFESGSAPFFQNIRVATSEVWYSPGQKHTGTGGLICVHNFGASLQALSNGSTAATACN
ncbi:MAG: hypothetical protein KatS3mg060_1947 [Dehalococcoidia bacterium]|nr:MAG: hypothetical protein KatS3mg060_1947 [Dehalococcoidia bacterium]